MSRAVIKIQNEPKAMEPFVPVEGLYVLTGTNDIEAISGALTNGGDYYFQKIWLYPGKAVNGTGQLTPNSGTIYVGKSGTAAGVTQYLPDSLTAMNSPMLIQLPTGQKMALSQIIITGTTGDGVFFSFT